MMAGQYGICAICGTVAPLHTCPLCGRLVCSNCLTAEGICLWCSRGRMIQQYRLKNSEF